MRDIRMPGRWVRLKGKMVGEADGVGRIDWLGCMFSSLSGKNQVGRRRGRGLEMRIVIASELGIAKTIGIR
jgi:hypothetical protein